MNSRGLVAVGGWCERSGAGLLEASFPRWAVRQGGLPRLVAASIFTLNRHSPSLLSLWLSPTSLGASLPAALLVPPVLSLFIPPHPGIGQWVSKWQIQSTFKEPLITLFYHPLQAVIAL